jgi:hypothetical protein
VTAAQSDASSLAAGVAEVDITPAPGVELMGYGARQGPATGVHDPLFARALYLRGGGGQLLLICADLCLIGPPQADEVRARISARTGIPAETMLISCSHTHSGPDTGLAARALGQPEPEHVPALFEGMERAACQAVERAAPARLRSALGELRIGRNRRTWDGPLDPDLLVLSVEDPDGSPRAVVFQHACHGTVLGHDNLEISADWAGVAAAQIAERTGAPALFLLGAHADIDPRTRGLMDLAIPGQSVGLGFEAVRILGEEAADAALAALADKVDAPPVVAARRARVSLPLQLGELPPADARRELDARKAALADKLEVGPEDFPRLSQLGGIAFERAGALPLAEARELLSETRLYLRDKSAPFFAGGASKVDVEVQVLRIGDALLVGLPVEPTTNVGLDWKRRMRGRFANAGVVGIANGWLRYLPHADDLAHPDARLHYEVLESILAPGACERLLEEAEKLATDL